MAQTITRLNIKTDVLAYLGPYNDPMFKRLTNQPLTTTSGGSTTTLVDTMLSRGTRSATDYNQFNVEIVELVGSGPADGSASAVTNGGFTAASGTLTVSPAFGSTVETGTDYLLYPPNLSPEALNGNINQVLRGTEAPAIWFPSLIDDSDLDLDTANAATYWPDVVGTPTQTFETSAALTLFGERSLKVVTTNSGDGVHNANAVSVTENEVLELSVHVACPTGSCLVQLIDVTNSNAVIDSTTVDEPRWTEVYFTATVPADCEQVRVRFLSATATTTFYVSAGIVLQSANEAFYKPPTWLNSPEQIINAIRIPHGYASEATDAYRSLTGGLEMGRRPDILRWDRAINPLLIGVCGGRDGIYALEVYRPFATLSSNSATTTIDREYVKTKVIAKILDQHNDPEAAKFEHRAGRLARIRGYGRREMRIVQGREVYV